MNNYTSLIEEQKICLISWNKNIEKNQVTNLIYLFDSRNKNNESNNTTKPNFVFLMPRPARDPQGIDDISIRRHRGRNRIEGTYGFMYSCLLFDN